ncbi:MAG: hypothetical protein IPH28_23490 [Cytophagaceae bacterium]|nr:hypothetical protein [Cytophagaceae bacterium]
MKILHVVEAFGGGIVEFILYLVNGMDNYEHIIYYAEREIPIEKVILRINNKR